MKTVTIMAANARIGDVYKGRRIQQTNLGTKRSPNKTHHKLAETNVLLIMKNRNGYKFDCEQMSGDITLVVKRPKYNFNNYKCTRSKRSVVKI